MAGGTKAQGAFQPVSEEIHYNSLKDLFKVLKTLQIHSNLFRRITGL